MGDDVIFPMPEATFHYISWAEVLCFFPGKYWFFFLCSFFSVAVLLHSAPEVHSFSLLKEFFPVPTCEKSLFFSGQSILGCLFYILHWLALRLEKEWIHDGLFIIVHAQKRPQIILQFMKHFSHWIIHSHNMIGLACDSGIWSLDWNSSLFIMELVYLIVLFFFWLSLMAFPSLAWINHNHRIIRKYILQTNICEVKSIVNNSMSIRLI